MGLLIAIDPGHSKCGLLLADSDGAIVIEGKVLAKSFVLEQINSWMQIYPVERIILGNGTSSNYWEEKLKYIVPIEVVNENGTTLRARYRYWELRPPNRLLRCIPKRLRFPPGNLDAFAALVLLEDYLSRKFIWPNPPRI